MKTILIFLIALCAIARAQEYVIEANVSSIEEGGLLVECKHSDIVGKKRAVGVLFLSGMPKWWEAGRDELVKCYGALQRGVVRVDGRDYVHFKWTRVRP